MAQLRRQSSNKLITQRLDTVLKFLRAAGPPVSSVLSGHGLVTREAKIQDVLGIVAAVAGDSVIGEAQLGQRNGRLAS
jgi:hypothetical protein